MTDSLKRDCRHFRTERPCKPHKLRGVVCETCDEYDPAGFRVAIVKLAAIGDVLRTTSFLPGLRRRYPNARISWLTLPGGRSLFDHNPYVDALHVTDGNVVPATLAHVPQDVVICPDADLTTAALAAGVALREGGRRVGFVLDANGDVQPASDAARHWFAMGVSDTQKKANTETYQNLVGAVFEVDTPVTDRPVLVLTEAERVAAKSWAKSVGIDPDTALIGINTGAGPRWPQKQWTLDGQIGFIRRMQERGARALLLGGPEEVERHAALTAACGDACIDAGTDNSLRAFAAKLDLCETLVTGDTLALHMGCALSKRIVALFGPTSSAEIELYGTGAKVFTDELDCLCCYASCGKKPNCMDLIRVDMVVDALQGVLAS